MQQSNLAANSNVTIESRTCDIWSINNDDGLQYSASATPFAHHHVKKGEHIEKIYHIAINTSSRAKKYRTKQTEQEKNGNNKMLFLHY